MISALTSGRSCRTPAPAAAPCPTTQPRRQPGRRPPFLEHLEARLLFSTSSGTDATDVGFATTTAAVASELPPTITITQAIPNAADQTVTLHYATANTNISHRVSLFFDQSGQGFAGTEITSNLPPSSDGVYVWNANGVPLANAHFYAVLLGALNQTVTSSYYIARTLSWDGSLSFTASDFTDAYSIPDPGGGLQKIQITSLPAQGALTLNSLPVTAGQEIPIDQLATLAYAPLNLYTGADSFEWTGWDGQSYAPSAAIVGLTVAETAPTVSTVAKALTRGSTLTFAAADFTAAFNDPDAGAALRKIKLTGLPTHGTLALAGIPVTEAQEIPAGQLANLTYTPTVAGSDSFAWTASDGLLYASIPASVNLNVTGTASPIGNLDTMSRERVVGWAFDADAGTLPIQVRVDIDGIPGTPFAADRPRPDLAGYPPVGSPNHGFSFALPQLSRTAHSVTVWLQQFPASTFVQLGAAQTIPAARPPVGYVDTVTSGLIGGWACDPDYPALALSIRISIDNTLYASLPANTWRPDLAAVVASPYHGFNYGLPQLAAGTHSVRVEAVGAVGTSTALLLATVTVNAPSTYFSESYYLGTYQDIAAAVRAGTLASGWAHFVAYGQREGRLPSPYYSETYYLANNADVAAAVQAGTFISGWDHFRRFGARDGRRATPLFSESFYLATYPDVAAAVHAGSFASGYEHFVLFGAREGRRSI